jgi:hypothetical protein
MKNAKSLGHGHRFPAAVISCAARWYFQFQLSLRDIEELLFERGVIVSYSGPLRPTECGPSRRLTSHRTECPDRVIARTHSLTLCHRKNSLCHPHVREVDHLAVE